MVGKQKALLISRVIHLFAGLFVILTSYLNKAGWLMWFGSAIFIILLIYQHTLVKYNDLRKVNLAFFTTNGIASMIYGTLGILSLYI